MTPARQLAIETLKTISADVTDENIDILDRALVLASEAGNGIGDRDAPQCERCGALSEAAAETLCRPGSEVPGDCDDCPGTRLWQPVPKRQGASLPPWIRALGANIFTARRAIDPDLVLVGKMETPEDADRAVDCVNGCAGIIDPSAVPDLLTSGAKVIAHLRRYLEARGDPWCLTMCAATVPKGAPGHGPCNCGMADLRLAVARANGNSVEPAGSRGRRG